MNSNIKITVVFTLLVTIVAGCMYGPVEKKDEPDTDKAYVIAYNVLFDPEKDNYEIFTMNPDGSGKKNITGTPGVDWTYYSFGDKLFFISDMDTSHRCYFLYETNYRGDNPRKVYGVQLADSWMSSRNNGTELILKPHRTIDTVFHIINLQGEIIQRLGTGLPFASDPLFVNSGRQVVFRGGLTRSKLVDGFNEELYIIDVDGNNRKQLTHYPQNDTTSGRYAYKAGPPKWNPTEKFVSYQSKQNGKYSLFGVTLDGTRQWKLTDNPQNEGWHEWSPDGKWLAIELFDDEQTQFHIGLMNWKTHEMKILTDTTFQYQQSPNFIRIPD